MDLCPIAAVLTYTMARGTHQGPFFITSAKLPLTKSEFVAAIRKVLVGLGLPDQQYAGHSFWIGAATSAALAGVEDSTIQLLGRWRSTAFLEPPRNVWLPLWWLKAMEEHQLPSELIERYVDN